MNVLTGDLINMVSCPPIVPVPVHQKKGGGVVKAAFWQRHSQAKSSLISPSWCHAKCWAKTGIESPSTSQSESTQGLWTEVEEAKNETFVIPKLLHGPQGLTFGFHKNRNAKIFFLKAGTVKGIRNGKLGLLWIVENNILRGRDGQKDKKCTVPPNSNTFGPL